MESVSGALPEAAPSTAGDPSEEAAPVLATQPEGTNGAGPRRDLGGRGRDLDLNTLRVRLDDQQALLRRTQQTLAGLAELLGKVVAHQRRRERGLNLNSFVAYILFTVLLGGGFFMLYSARAGDLVAARDAAVQARDQARARVAEVEAEQAARAQAAAAAQAFSELVREGRHAEVVAGYAEIEGAGLTATEAAVFADGVETARAALAEAGFAAGVEAFESRRYELAERELRQALSFQDDGPGAARGRYYLGVSLLELGRNQEAVTELERAIAGEIEAAGLKDARFLLAVALERQGEAKRAQAEYLRVATDYPQLPMGWTARRRANLLARAAATAPAAN
ncbi:tetratricopeptide repeat protein [Haliangium sp.]|uniref:tetratricopeptide repeat protein n=1 Tax=Haliangium sp. TaxID=2663208 RepID=UPI003D0A9119